MKTSIDNINKIGTKKRVLIAPLDWGLGHATRCVPVITALLKQGFEVIIGAEGVPAILLAQEFPFLKILPLPGYNVSYSKNKRFFFPKMMLQFPKIKAAIKQEKQWLKKAIKEYAIDIVLSDNRFGLRNKNVRCIFITHQLFIKTGRSFTEKIAQKINYGYINKFNECWVPDVEGKMNLAGELSHPDKMPDIPVKYIDTLSRFEKKSVEKNIDLLVLLSGPEPQRTIFENILLPQMQKLNIKSVLVRGLPAADKILNAENKNITIIDHLAAAALNDMILRSKTVIARSGYSTVMDLAALQQKAILVPTPGQTEQEYLAEYLSEKKYCITASQESFDLKNSLLQLENTDLVPFPEKSSVVLQEAITLL